MDARCGNSSYQQILEMQNVPFAEGAGGGGVHTTLS